jgi:hypothetical protein
MGWWLGLWGGGWGYGVRGSWSSTSTEGFTRSTVEKQFNLHLASAISSTYTLIDPHMLPHKSITAVDVEILALSPVASSS